MIFHRKTKNSNLGKVFVNKNTATQKSLTSSNYANHRNFPPFDRQRIEIKARPQYEMAPGPTGSTA